MRAGAIVTGSTPSGCVDAGVSAGRVFVAEDDPLVRRLVVRELERDGHLVIAAETGRPLLERMLALAGSATDRRDVLVSDIDMPGMSGVQLVAALREAGWHELGVVLMSGSLGRSTAASGSHLRVDRFFEKPFSMQELREAVAELVVPRGR